VRGLILLASAAVTLAVFAPADASSRSAARFRVVSAKGTASLTFRTQSADANSTSTGTIKLSVAPKGTGRGTPYQEKTGANAGKVSGRGGLRFRSVHGRIEARWLLPQANPRFCSGPRASSAITSKMTRLYPASKFSGRTAIVVVAGTKKTHSATADLTYRWRVTVKLAQS
jgi:hypothetical protein